MPKPCCAPNRDIGCAGSMSSPSLPTRFSRQAARNQTRLLLCLFAIAATAGIGIAFAVRQRNANSALTAMSASGVPTWVIDTLSWNQDLSASLGEICAGAPYSRRFRFQNESRHILQITRTETSCLPCAEIAVNRHRINPGEVFEVDLHGVATDEVGYEKKMLMEAKVYFVARAEPLKVAVHGTVIQPVPVVLDFGEIEPEEGQVQSFLIRTCDGSPPTVSSVSAGDTRLAALVDDSDWQARGCQIAIRLDARQLSGIFVSHLDIFNNAESDRPSRVAVRAFVKSPVRCEPNALSLTGTDMVHSLTLWSQSAPFRVTDVTSSFIGLIWSVEPMEKSGKQYQVRITIPALGSEESAHSIEIKTTHPRCPSIVVPVYRLHGEVVPTG